MLRPLHSFINSNPFRHYLFEITPGPAFQRRRRSPSKTNSFQRTRSAVTRTSIPTATERRCVFWRLTLLQAADWRHFRRIVSRCFQKLRNNFFMDFEVIFLFYFILFSLSSSWFKNDKILFLFYLVGKWQNFIYCMLEMKYYLNHLWKYPTIHTVLNFSNLYNMIIKFYFFNIINKYINLIRSLEIITIENRPF